MVNQQQKKKKKYLCLQPSLSLDNAVEVFLLKNEGEFVSVEQGNQKLGSSNISVGEKKKRREENMRQLLDVTNTITSEEMRDFEMRYAIVCKKETCIISCVVLTIHLLPVVLFVVCVFVSYQCERFVDEQYIHLTS